MTRVSDEQAFYVVQFLILPYEGIDDYVCVPKTCVLSSVGQDERSIVAYPKDEDPSLTRDRAKRMERYSDEWKFYMAAVKHQSNSYQNAECWIASRNDHRPSVERIADNLVERETRRMHVIDTEPESTPNPNSRHSTQGHSSKLNDNPPKPLPRTLIKRPALPEPNKQLDGKRLKPNKAAKTSSASVTDANTESKREQSTSIQDTQSTKTQETAAAANIISRTEQRTQTRHTKQNKEALSLHVIDVDGPPEVIEIDDRHHSPGIKTSNQNNSTSHSHLSNTVTVLTSAAKSTTSTERNTQPNQYHNQEHILDSEKQARMSQQSTEHNNRELTSGPKNVAVSTISDKHQNVIDNARQTGECIVKPLSPHYPVTSASDAVTDEGIADHELSTDRAPVERINDSTSTEIASASSSADRPTIAQNFTSINSSIDVRSTLEQEMLDNFATLVTEMGSTLRYTTDMFNTLRGSILDTAKTYKKLLGAIKEFNSMQNSAGIESFSSNLNPKARQPLEERHAEVTASTSSSTQDQHSNDDVNKPPKKKHNSWRFVLPPEYDPHDTKWSLKYRTNLPGLVELMPQSGVYVSYGDLKYCQHVSRDCKSLAGRLLSAVFNRKALSVCLSITERAQASYNVGSNVRPELDDHACTVLLNFVLEHGLQRGWNTDLQPILSTLHSMIQNIRFKYGVMVQC